MNVKQYFKDYPGRKECFQTSDGYLFHLKTDADNYAATLKDKAVKTHQRDFEKVEAVEEAEPLIGEEKETEAVTDKPAKAPRKKAAK